MKIMKSNPIFAARQLSSIFDDAFNTNFGQVGFNSNWAATLPSVNITENDDAFLLELAAPGLTKEDFNITLNSDQLEISVSKEHKSEEKEEGKWYRKEFNYTSFKRSFHVNDTIDTDCINAEYVNGILTLTLPKKEDAKPKAPKTITIA
jgi:HSP20 family protein